MKEPSAKTLTALLAEFLDYGRSLRASPHTVKARRYHVTAFINWVSGRGVRAAGQLRREHLRAWIRHLAEHRTSRGMPLKPRSINKQIESLRSFLYHLARQGYVQTALPDALDYVKEPKLLPTGVLTHDQVRKLLRQVPTDTPEGFRDRTMLEVLYSTGIRASELLGMDVEEVDIRSATALVHGKGEKDRVVPIGRTALRHLESYIVGVRPFLAGRGLPNDGHPLFLDSKGKRVPYHVLRRLIRRYGEQSGVDPGVPGGVTAHTFRRSCTTELLRSGANMYHVKELLGHESLDTLKHYAKLTITDLKKTHAKCHPREKDDNQRENRSC